MLVQIFKFRNNSTGEEIIGTFYFNTQDYQIAKELLDYLEDNCLNGNDYQCFTSLGNEGADLHFYEICPVMAVLEIYGKISKVEEGIGR